MKQKQSDPLEQLISRELKGQPDLRAPETLLHRVMLAVHERRRQPWYRRAWPEWPVLPRMISLLVLTGLAVVAVWMVAAYGPPSLTGWLQAEIEAGLRPWEPFWKTLGTLWGAGSILYRSVFHQVLLIGTLLALASYLLAMGVFTAGYRMFVRSSSPRF